MVMAESAVSKHKKQIYAMLYSKNYTIGFQIYKIEVRCSGPWFQLSLGEAIKLVHEQWETRILACV